MDKDKNPTQANAYHYLQTFTVVQDDLTDGRFSPAILHQLRSSARHRFLEQLGAHTGGLAKRELRLRIHDITRSRSFDVTAGELLAVTQRLERIEAEMVIVESVYLVTRNWMPLFQERIRVRVENHRGQSRMPEALQKSARKWMGLIRGLTSSGDTAAQINSQS
ncbi:MAG: hypothetical protein L0H73_11300 [Nitrococcus sp.]|nr:hypothetical protein [Nitrococcus sp.]